MITNSIKETKPVIELLKLSNANPIEKYTQYDDLKNLINDLYDQQIIYKAAVKEVMTKLNILNDEFIELHSRNPIHTMKSRIKEPSSIIEKLIRKGFEVSMKGVRENIEDIAGIRIVCPYIKDIYVVKQLVENQDDLELTRVTDYIKNPKANGYRSLHMILIVPVYFSDHKEKVKVEIQIRTIAMDFWASLEHQLRYKSKRMEAVPQDISDELKACADIIANTDIRMQDIHNRVSQEYD